jgi:hypothetical protein
MLDWATRQLIEIALGNSGQLKSGTERFANEVGVNRH